MYKALDKWLPAYLRRKRRLPPTDGPTDILICVCDHFEPFHDTDKDGALARLDSWIKKFPPLIRDFKDADGIRPRHTFFYPIEQYDRDVIDRLEKLCDASGGEVEIHLHHNNDTPEGLREKLDQGISDFRKHGFLSRDPAGAIRYAFIHGDWALDDSHPDARHCGVRNELRHLRESGCYADFTMPSAPSPTQTRTINSLYYAKSSDRPKSHDTGERASAGDATHTYRDDPERLLLIQVPLGLNWERRKRGVIPRIENGDLTSVNPPTMDRLRLWLRLHNHVVGRPDTLFIKLHTHGAIDRNSSVFLGDPYRIFHEELLRTYNDGEQYRVHYVTARESANILHALEDGMTGSPGQYRDYLYKLAGKPEADRGA